MDHICVGLDMVTLESQYCEDRSKAIFYESPSATASQPAFPPMEKHKKLRNN